MLHSHASQSTLNDMTAIMQPHMQQAASEPLFHPMSMPPPPPPSSSSSADAHSSEFHHMQMERGEGRTYIPIPMYTPAGPPMPLSTAPPPPMDPALPSGAHAAVGEESSIPSNHPHCVYCNQEYDFQRGVGPYCSHQCAERFYSERKQVRAELERASGSTPRRRTAAATSGVPLTAVNATPNAMMATQIKTHDGDTEVLNAHTIEGRFTQSILGESAVKDEGAGGAGAPSPVKRRRSQPRKKVSMEHDPSRVKYEFGPRPTMPSAAIPAAVVQGESVDTGPPTMGVIATQTSQMQMAPVMAAAASTSKTMPAQSTPHFSFLSPMSFGVSGHPPPPLGGQSATPPTANRTIRPNIPITFTHTTPHMTPQMTPHMAPHKMSTEHMPPALSGSGSSHDMPSSMMGVASSDSHLPSQPTQPNDPQGPMAPLLPPIGLDTSMPSFHSPLMYGFNSPRSIFRQTGQHSFLHHDPSPEPAFRHAAQSHKPMSDVPMMASTVINRANIMSNPFEPLRERRSSISKSILETDEERLHGEESESDHAPFSCATTPTSGGLGGGLSRNPLAPHLRLQASTISSGSTPPSSTRMLNSIYTPPSSVPTTPIRRFFPFAPVTSSVTLVPSPRMESKLQQASRAHQELTRAQNAAARRFTGGHLHGGSSEDDDDYDAVQADIDEELLSREDGESSRAAARARKRKRARRQENRGGAPRKRNAKPRASEEGVLSIESVASTLTSVSRISRRKSVPPAIFGEEDESSGPNTSKHTTSADEPTDDPDADLPKDKDCELCHRKHAGTYGGGRFCGAHCARHYSIVHRWEKKQGR